MSARRLRSADLRSSLGAAGPPARRRSHSLLTSG